MRNIFGNIDAGIRLCVIGGGASGMAAAIAAASRKASVTVYEAGERVLTKLLRTGGGRCNFTNRNMSANGYNAQDSSFTGEVLSRFGVEDVVRFMSGIGVETVYENDGWAYPMSRQASGVADMLRFRCDALGVRVLCSRRIVGIKRGVQRFVVKDGLGGEEYYDRVIYAAGSNSSLQKPVSELAIVSELGQPTRSFCPALVQLKTDKEAIRGLAGQRAEVNIKACSGGRLVSERGGELLFTEYGVSGIALMSLSYLANRHGDLKLSVDFVPALTEKELYTKLAARAESLAYLGGEDFLSGLVAKRIGMAVSRGLPKTVAAYGERELRLLCGRLKAYELNVTGTMGIKSSQVSDGGVLLSGIDPATMESRHVKGLYFAGETMDIAGECGGYNLHWAFATGLIAGESAAHA